MAKVAGRKSLQRAEPRTQVLPVEIKGLLANSNHEIQLPFLVWDVSDSGIGLWTSRPLEVGAGVFVTIGRPYSLGVDCQIIWCHGQEEQGYRMGLRVLTTEKAFRSLVEALHRDHGCRFVNET